ncbi:hypothetical protein SPSIL_007470 [Sporomusa silvacetica DSM 10669]|uniref:SLH domain-containing protein n=1 Tax=Sporomusa silvacetica DSM 10669 TaxID=1123289 RepID=A0ABZ3IG38_9FIRM|nr:porin [Sporomusa silvacetica]OZC16498.1 outer membrane protein alpha precursor [Sporomusa silvacetica DSM 10669]
MKRQTAMALAAVFAMSVAGTALAAPANPFVDVPANHWAYDSINKLAQAGVISGYGDGTFKGDKTLTRYEVATIVAKAMANSEKADAASKKEIEALKAEFGTELNNLGVRVDNLEKNASKVKFTGEVRTRYNDQDNVQTPYVNGKSGNNSTTRFRLNMEAPIDQNVTFHGRYEAEGEWGTSATSNLTQAYITGKASGLDYSFGRQPIWLGQGLLADIEGNCDGLLVSGGKDVKVTVGAFKTSGTNYYWYDEDISANFQVANIDAKVTDNLHVSLSYLKMDDDYYGKSAYKSTSVGLNYTGIKNFTVSGEYGQNDSDVTKDWYSSDGEKAKAWMAKIQYAGAQKDKIGSFGAWIGYRKADLGFDLCQFTTLDSGSQKDWYFGNLDNVKGAEFGVEYTVFRNGIFTFQYNDLEAKDSWYKDKDKKNFFAQLEYSF